MSQRIPQSFIDDLLARIDIVEVIDENLPLRKAGRNFQALCPFHAEKTPSFTVNRDKQFYYCFGCGAHGTALGFLIAYARLSFLDAVARLAARAGLSLPSEGHEAARPTWDGHRECLEQAADLFAAQLRRHPAAERARNYLQRRGLSGRTAADFQLGYAPPGWDNLLRALGSSPETLEKLVGVGLLVRKEGEPGCYDRFRDRIMFPIRDARGRMAGFGGRVLDEGEPKYLNSPESPLFRKGAELYGLHHALRAPGETRRLLVVEGYTDVLSLVQHGVSGVVATLGTALTREHLVRLFRATADVVFCFDGDEAGRRAAWRALEVAVPQLNEGRSAGFLFLPQGEDPDTLVRSQGPSLFRDPQAVTPLSEFLFKHLIEQTPIAGLDGKARLVERCRPLIAQIPSEPLQALLRQRLAELSGLYLDQLPRAAEPYAVTLAPRRPAPGSQPVVTLVRQGIALLLRNPSLAGRAPPDLAEVERPGIPLLVELIEVLRREPQLECAMILERWAGREEQGHLARLAIRELPLDEAAAEMEFEGVIGGLRRLLDKQRRGRHWEQTARALQDPDACMGTGV
ncbi:MAG: DNA primase [Gammaproteobacteria bacterium]